MIAQPAEETGEGARAMLSDGLYTRFPRPDFALALQTIVSREVPPVDPAVVTVGSVHGGLKYNIIPDEVHLQITVRAFREEIRRKILSSIERISRGVALAAGIPDSLSPIMKVSEAEYVPALYNDPPLTERMTRVFSETLGKENVLPWPPAMLAEDFARYALEDHTIATCLFWLGASDPAKVAEARRTGVSLPSLHSARFQPVAEPTIRTGVKAMTSAVLELLRK